MLKIEEATCRCGHEARVHYEGKETGGRRKGCGLCTCSQYLNANRFEGDAQVLADVHRFKNDVCVLCGGLLESVRDTACLVQRF